MTFAMYPSYVFTVLLMVVNIYYLLGGLPLLTLEHDVPLDAKFTHSFFRIYCTLSAYVAICATVSYALWARPAFALGGVCLAAVAILIRTKLLPLLDQAGAGITSKEASAVTRFRKLHGVTLLLIVLQIQLLLFGVVELGKNPIG